MYLIVTLCAIVVYLPSKIKSVPPEICFQKFRSDDCGYPPQPVMYYWKPGSRCEVGFWRGCVPNVNMFKDEHECVSTCIFARRARPIDYHSYNALEYEDSDGGDDDVITTENNSNGTTNGDLTTGNDHHNVTDNSDSTDKTDKTGSQPVPTGGSDTTAAA